VTESQKPKVDWNAVKAFLAVPNGGSYAGLVVPGSPAERWTAFAGEWALANQTSGGVQPEPPAYVYDEEANSVTAKYSDGKDVILKNWVTDDQGRVADYSDADGRTLGQRLATTQPTGTVGTTTVTATNAFLTSAGSMCITVRVTTGDEFLDWDATYVGPDNIARQASTAAVPEPVGGAVSVAVYCYDGAGFGGKFVYEASNGDWYTGEITLVIA
jgi:hypothetical protein